MIAGNNQNLMGFQLQLTKDIREHFASDVIFSRLAFRRNIPVKHQRRRLPVSLCLPHRIETKQTANIVRMRSE